MTILHDLLGTVERMWEWTYTNRVKTSLATGIILGTAKLIELHPYLGGPYLDPDSNVTVNMDQGALAIYVATRASMWAACTFMPLELIKRSKGFRNLARMIQYEMTPEKNSKKRKDILEKLCNNTSSPYYKMRRARMAIFEENDISIAAEYVRRAISDVIREEYTCVNGRAEYNKKTISRFLDRRADDMPGEKELAVMENQIRIAEDIERYRKTGEMEDKTAGFLKETGIDPATADIKTPKRNAKLGKKCVTAFMRAREGKLDQAESELESICYVEPKITNRCIYGSFLDNVSSIDDDYKDRSRAHWTELMQDIIANPEFESQFTKIPGSKNEVLEFNDDPTKKSMLIVKRSSSRDDLEKEFNISRFLSDMTIERSIVPQALTFKEHKGMFYFIQKRYPGKTMQDMLISDHSKRDMLLKNFIETLDEYQRAVQRNKGIAHHYGFDIVHMDYGKEFQKKFVERIREDADMPELADIIERMKPIFRTIEAQRQGGCHGDMHAKNIIIYDNYRTCIIDNEKMGWGARILDWVNFILHNKVEAQIDLTGDICIGYEIFKRRGMSEEEYLLAYHSGSVFKAAHMAGTISKYLHKKPLGNEEGIKRRRRYIDEAIDSLNSLKNFSPLKDRNTIELLIESYCGIRRALSTSNYSLPSACL